MHKTTKQPTLSDQPQETNVSVEPTYQRQVLHFDTDKGAWRARFIAAVLIIALVAWMGSGFLYPSEAPKSEEKAATISVEPQAVMVKSLTAEVVTTTFRAEGQAEPDRDTPIRAESAGDIAELLVNKGDWVELDQLLAQLDTTRMQAEVERTEQALKQAQRDFDNAQTLLNKGVATVDSLTKARAGLAAAKSAYTNAQESLKNTEIRAPFAGRLEALTINEGEFIAAGTEIGRVVDNTPLTIAIRVPQQTLKRIKVGQQASVNFITGEQAVGTVTFVGSNADPETRTFLAEVAVENSEGAIPAGVSAEVIIPTEAVKAQFVSPAIMSLSAAGELGIKSVNANHEVVFHPVTIVHAQTDGLWVAGLPDQVDVITVGQGFVSQGDPVNPQSHPEFDQGLEKAGEADQKDAA